MDATQSEPMPNLDVGLTTNAAGAINAPVGIVTMSRLLMVLKAILGGLPFKKKATELSLQDVVMSANFNDVVVKPRASKNATIDSIVEAVAPRTELKIWPRSLDWETFTHWCKEGVFGRTPGQITNVKEIDPNQDVETDEKEGALAAFIKSGGVVDPDSYDEIIGINADLRFINTRRNAIILEDYVTSSHKVDRRNPVSANVDGQTIRLTCAENFDHYTYGLRPRCHMGKTNVPSALPAGTTSGVCPQCKGPTYRRLRDKVSKQNMRLMLPVWHDGEPLRKDRYKVQILGKSGAGLRATINGKTRYHGGRLERVLFNVYHPTHGNLTAIGWAMITGIERGVIDPLDFDERITRSILNTLRHGRKHTSGKVKVQLEALARLMAEY